MCSNGQYSCSPLIYPCTGHIEKLGVIEKKGKKVFWTPERIKQLEGLATKGATLEEAADALNTTIMVVGKRAKADGLELKKEEKAA